MITLALSIIGLIVLASVVLFIAAYALLLIEALKADPKKYYEHLEELLIESRVR